MSSEHMTTTILRMDNRDINSEVKGINHDANLQGPTAHL